MAYLEDTVSDTIGESMDRDQRPAQPRSEYRIQDGLLVLESVLDSRVSYRHAGLMHDWPASYEVTSGSELHVKENDTVTRRLPIDAMYLDTASDQFLLEAQDEKHGIHRYFTSLRLESKKKRGFDTAITPQEDATARDARLYADSELTQFPDSAYSMHRLYSEKDAETRDVRRLILHEALRPRGGVCVRNIGLARYYADLDAWGDEMR